MGLVSSRPSSPTSSMVSDTSRASVSGSAPMLRGPYSSSSRQVSWKIWRSGFWKTYPTVAARWCSRVPRVSTVRPSRVCSRTAPPGFVGLSRPLKCLARVVLPEPFRPMIATNSPRPMVRSTPARALAPVP